MRRNEFIFALLLATVTRSIAANPLADRTVTASPDRIFPNAAPVIERVMLIADKDKDGRLTLAEYLPLDVQARHHGDEHFKKGDANGDGFLDRVELATVLRKQTWFAILSEGAESCFARLDLDNNRKLDAREYRKVSRMGGHAEQHHRGADTDRDGQLNLAEFKTHAEAKLKSAAELTNRKKKKSKPVAAE